MQQSIDLLKEIETKTASEFLDKIVIMEKLKISKKNYECYVADQLLNPSELEGNITIQMSISARR